MKEIALVRKRLKRVLKISVSVSIKFYCDHFSKLATIRIVNNIRRIHSLLKWWIKEFLCVMFILHCSILKIVYHNNSKHFIFLVKKKRQKRKVKGSCILQISSIRILRKKKILKLFRSVAINTSKTHVSSLWIQ